MATRQKQELEQFIAELDLAIEDLTEYRGHLARHLSEGEFDAKELAELADDTAVVTSDFKMKILSVFFRENQNKFFGKRGTTCLGFMILYNSTDPKLREQNKKEAEYVMLFTDDSLQDETEVMCGKAYVYANLLRDHISKVIFRADGAGCFSSKLNRVAQPFWQSWVGVTEIVNRLSPAGGGKSSLDGMFGRLGAVMESAADAGHGYSNATEILNAVGHSNGLASTRCFTFKPDRQSCVLSADIRGWPDSILRTELDPYDFSLRAFKHSGYGKGYLIRRQDAFLFNQEKSPKMPAKKDPPGAMQCYSPSPVAALVATFVGHEDAASKQVPFVLRHCGLSAVNLNHGELSKAVPGCINVYQGVNTKQEVGSIAFAGTSDTRKVARKKRAKRFFDKAERKREDVDHQRDMMRKNGIFLCDAQCSITGRFCTARFLLEGGLAKHTTKNKHVFPKGIRSKDRAALLAARPGGALAVGSRPDRMAKVVQRQIREAPEGSRGLENVACYGKFNRIEGKPVYQKPEKLRKELLRLYNIGGDKKTPKLNAAQIHDELRKMVDPVDKGLLFCHSKRGTHVAKKDPAYKNWEGCPICKTRKSCTCNGMLPTIAMIQNFINGTTQSNNKKKKSELAN
jgi:hypothetical protein